MCHSIHEVHDHVDHDGTHDNNDMLETCIEEIEVDHEAPACELRYRHKADGCVNPFNLPVA